MVKSSNNNKVAIIGDMKELGIYSANEHKEIIRFNLENNLKAYYVGTEFYKLGENKVNFFENVDNLLSLKLNPISNSLILLKVQEV